ncbi:MAG: PAS domain-containing sensor histidine kinase [Anaeromyxobacter sp. RBG_16_69_14]|nr:MAG: PAS domain-containing sensor histidine kinase [Anaeromyxobacter sp. RBG_16_69_14]
MDFSLLESVPDAMIITHRDGRIVHVNTVAETLFGWVRAELVGNPIDVLLPARFRAMHQVHRSGYHAAPRTRPMGLGLDLFGLRKDGEEFAAEISLSPLSVGGEVYAIAAVRDVTERKKLEQRAQLYRKAQEEVRERDEFLSIASHELRTPVTALQLQLQLIQRAAGRPGGALPEALAAKMDALERQCRRIALLVNELLDVSRLRLGHLELRLEEIDLVELAREAVAHLVEEGIRLGSRIDIVGEGAAIGRWDRLRLEQVITNLLSNAIKFGESKPITVEVGADPERARLTVRDQGIGIEPSDQDRVFGRFERAVSTEHFGGLGLGLYIAREIVVAHGGRIHLASTPGSGATFTVDLPRVPPVRAPQSSEGGVKLLN